ncbi:MAG: zinc-binding alcohol dehydrogenase family protein [Pigmentiphaga sp.]
MSSMRAVVMHEQGAPSVLRVERVPVPHIAPHEVLLKVGSVGVSYHDVVERNGAYRHTIKLPMIIGYEIAGTVERVGQQVATLKVGDRVCAKPFYSCGLCRRCRNGLETACAQRQPVRGGYAEYVALPEETLARIPDALSFDVACMIGASTGVALNAVRDTAKVQLGESVLITGASGGLGLPSIELARAAGAMVIAVTRSAGKRESLLSIGAHHAIVAPDGRDFAAEAKELTGGEGVDVVIDNVGSRVFTPSFRSLAIGGRYAFVGQLYREDIAFNPALIFFKRAQLLGVGSVRRDQLHDAIRLVAAGRANPHVATIMPLEAAADAHALVEAGGQIGRVVLQP